jgi:hypothetical protein
MFHSAPISTINSPNTYDGLKKNADVDIIQQRSKTFKFINEFDPESNEYSIVKINFLENHYHYENRNYYQISYNIKDYKNEVECIFGTTRSNPFYNLGFDEEKISFLMNGESVLKNPFTQTLVTFLLMNDNELEKHTGRTTLQTYRRNLMISLDNFWD